MPFEQTNSRPLAVVALFAALLAIACGCGCEPAARHDTGAPRAAGDAGLVPERRPAMPATEEGLDHEAIEAIAREVYSHEYPAAEASLLSELDLPRAGIGGHLDYVHCIESESGGGRSCVQHANWNLNGRCNLVLWETPGEAGWIVQDAVVCCGCAQGWCQECPPWAEWADDEGAAGRRAEIVYECTFPAFASRKQVVFGFRCEEEPDGPYRARVAVGRRVDVWTGSGYSGRFPVIRSEAEGCCDGTACTVTVAAGSKVFVPGPAVVVIPCGSDDDCSHDVGCRRGRCVARSCAASSPPPLARRAGERRFDLDRDGAIDAVAFPPAPAVCDWARSLGSDLECLAEFMELWVYQSHSGAWERSWMNTTS